MRYPLNTMTVVPGGQFKALRTDGTGLPDEKGVKRHIGVDLRASIGTPFYAPGAGTVTQSSVNPKTGLQIIEVAINGMSHRFLHLSRRDVKVGDTTRDGLQLGLTGNSGGVLAHLHWDVRKFGTQWDSSLNNYVDPMGLGDNMAEPLFNEGDRFNMNTAFYGKDLGYHKDQVGKPYKQAMEGIISSKDFKFQQQFNAGDAVNVNASIGRTDAQSQVGKIHKDVIYQYFLKLPPQNFKPYSGPQLYVK